MEDFSKELLSNNKVAGLRQVVRGIRENQIWCVLIAEDADVHIKRELKDLCAEKGIPVRFCDSKEELGREIGIQIGCAAVGLLK